MLGASMIAFYRRLSFVHVEAGARTGDRQSPRPKEFNRRVAGLTAAVHCAPTRRSADNLLAEGVAPQSVHVAGNAVIDALWWTANASTATAGARGSEPFAASFAEQLKTLQGVQIPEPLNWLDPENPQVQAVRQECEVALAMAQEWRIVR